MQAGKGWIRWALGLGGAVILAALLYRSWPRERLLLPQSTLIADMSSWGYAKRFYNSIGIHWLSDDMLLFNRFVATGNSQHNVGDRIIYRRNVQTGQEEKLPGLTATREDFETEVVDSQNVSPDGRWYLCSDRWRDCLLAEVNGSRSYRYPSLDSGCYRELHWMPDSRHWLENYGVNGTSHCVVLHDVAHPKLSQTLPLHGRGDWYCDLKCLRSSGQAISVLEPEKDDNDHGSISTPITVLVWSLATGRLISQYQFASPLTAEHAHLWVSPQGDRIAWQVTAANADPLRTWLHRLIPRLQANPSPTVGLWISRLDGSHVHEIGHIVVEPKAGDIDDPIPWLDVHWLPGGKKLSYEYEDRLYTVAAD